ncbi:MAG: SAM-dependent methyltransferase [Rhodospirillales bacterium]|nr:SAM-dependent methyltransferase [Rhodospirillales bacterium]
MSDDTRPHSSAYFGEERDYWWNDDYLDLLARRLRLDQVRTLADIGCGIGHWGGSLAGHLAPGTQLIGIDRDPANVAGARERFARRAPDRSARFLEGDALALPLADGSVDLATCQTLLIHLAEPQKAIAEMIRVTRPGGQVVAVESNNLFNRMAISSLTPETPLERLLAETEIAWRQVEGRRRRGLGCEYLGDLVPALFAEAGLADIRVWLATGPCRWCRPMRRRSSRRSSMRSGVGAPTDPVPATGPSSPPIWRQAVPTRP